MKTAIITSLVGLAAAAVLVGAGATGSTPAAAGGSGDFYHSGSCGFSNGLRAKLTNYDIATGQRYHHSMNTASGYWINYIQYNSKTWPFDSKYSGTKADGYQDFSVRSTKYSVTFNWINADMVGKRCTVYF